MLSILFVLLFSNVTPAETAKVVSLANAIVCEPNSGQIPYQSQLAYEVSLIDKRQLMEVPKNATVEESLRAYLKDYSATFPVRSYLLENAALKTLRQASRQNAPNEILLGGALVPEFCRVASVIFRDENKTIAIDENYFSKLSGFHQAITLLQVAVQELFKQDENVVRARELVRLLISSTPVTKKMAEDMTKVGYDSTLEYVYENGDVALYRPHYSGKINPTAVEACGYHLASGIDVNSCPDFGSFASTSQRFSIYAEGSKRILRIEENYNPNPVYMVSPSSLGFPSTVTDYVFPQWNYGRDLRLKLQTDVPVKGKYFELTCAANSSVNYLMPDKDAKTFNASWDPSRIASCTPNGVIRVRWAGQVIQLAGRDPIRLDETRFTISDSDQPKRITIGRHEFTLKSGDQIRLGSDAVEFKDRKKDPPMKFAIVDSICDVFPTHVSITGKEKELTAELKGRCRIKSDKAEIILAGNVVIDLTDDSLVSMSATWEDQGAIEIFGKKLRVREMSFNKFGLPTTITTPENEKSVIHYFDTASNKMSVSAPESNYYNERTFCLNHKEKRFEKSGYYGSCGGDR